MSNGWNSAAEEAKLNAEESKFGDTMSAAEVAVLVKDPPKPELTPEQEEALKNPVNVEDIYRVSARVKNLARDNGNASLTPVGDILCNAYTHVLVALYTYAESTKDEKLKALIKKHENLPADVIFAAKAGVRRG